MSNSMDPAVKLGNEFFRELQENPGHCLTEMRLGFDPSQDQYQKETHAVAVIQAFQHLANDPLDIRKFNRNISVDEIRNPQCSKLKILKELFKLVHQSLPCERNHIDQLFSTLTHVESRTLVFADGSEKIYPVSVLEELSPSHFAQMDFREAYTQRHMLIDVDQKTFNLLIKIAFSETAIEAIQDEIEEIELSELIQTADYFQNSQTMNQLIPLITESLRSAAEKKCLQAIISILEQCNEFHLLIDLIRAANTTKLPDKLVENFGTEALIKAFSTLPVELRQGLTHWLKPAVVRCFVRELKSAAQVISSDPSETTGQAIVALDQTVLKWFGILTQFELEKYSEIIKPFVNSRVSSKNLENPNREILASLLEEVKSIIQSSEIFYNADNHYSELDPSTTDYLSIDGLQAFEILIYKPAGHWLLRWSENHKRCFISIVTKRKDEQLVKEVHHFPLIHPSQMTWKSISFNTFWSWLPRFSGQRAYRSLREKGGDIILIRPEFCVGGFPKNKF